MASRNPTPKERFAQSKDNLKAHHAMIEMREFDRAVDTSLAEYNRILARPATDANPNAALASFYKAVGAQEFVSVLKNLAEEPLAVAPRIVDQLDHKA